MRKVVITGGNKGIGLALTQRFVEAGDKVQIIARDFSNQEEFDYQNHPLVTCTQFDLSEVDKLPELVAQIDEVDVLINNAGLLQPITYENYPDDRMDYSLNLNLIAPVKLTTMLEDKLNAPSDYTPRVVNNASIAGQIGHPDIWYGIAKAGLINATKAFSKAFQGKIIVNAVAPSPTETDLLQSIPEHRQQAFLRNTISGRFATAKEVADTMYWLGTECPEYINGVCIDINNGSLPR
ncbi:SDR family NAD(P)-dependent oxidoreductase [Thiomicrorhabdus sp. ZW0627]|uniref:SDR family oxidoreductase n=1 Tax=Thiomicrorhabdus sp. ZW0627 TaxID=3039774 RepID=UPI002436AC66|nr:SDR family NAD(P)-dependent oxidoreductase [Thiomicrorhabdus sp. ZW0627]MDG6774389.1 SDR family NAD(P)-dependent oxidoreductase [Thiomicrorhabdus sp. ZW0627]